MDEGPDLVKGWLDGLPARWQVIDPRRHFRERREAALPGDVHLTPSQHHGVLSQEDYMARTGTRVVLNLSAPDNMKRVRRGDLVAHLRSFQGGLEMSDLGGTGALYHPESNWRNCMPPPQ